MTAGYRTKEQRSITYNIHNIFLKGGKIVQMSPAEVLPSGGDWGSSGQDQQGCGHKVKLHSYLWPKINSMERQSGGLQIVGGESLCNLICNVKAWWICDEGGEGCCSNQWLLYLVLRGKSDRSIGCCGDASGVVVARINNQQAGPII